MIFINGARVLRASGLVPASVLVDGATVIAVGDLSPPPGSRVIEATGAMLGPGLVDLHVHLRDPGQTWKEDIASGSAAAVPAGSPRWWPCPTPILRPTTRRRLSTSWHRAAEVGLVDVVVAGALTRGREGMEMADFDSMYESGVRMFTDDGDSVADAGLLRRIMAYLGRLSQASCRRAPRGPVDLPGTARSTKVWCRRVTASVGFRRWPRTWSWPGIWLWLPTPAPGSTSNTSPLQASVELIRRAKESGLDVTCEVTPHHLGLDESAVDGLDTEPQDVPAVATPRQTERWWSPGWTTVRSTRWPQITPHTPPSEKDAPVRGGPARCDRARDFGVGGLASLSRRCRLVLRAD